MAVRAPAHILFAHPLALPFRKRQTCHDILAHLLRPCDQLIIQQGLCSTRSSGCQDHIHDLHIRCEHGCLQAFQCTRMAYGLHLPQAVIRKAVKFMQGLYACFTDKDCSLVETNPFVVTADDEVLALDAKLNFDDSALFRHPEIEMLRDEAEENAKEREAAQAGLNYVDLGGDVACMVNGAGLAMATVDIIKYFGGDPANFLDVGGDSTPEKIAKAFSIMLEDGQAKGIFVNIFGGINRCDLVAEGIVKAAKMISSDGKSLPVPVVVRLEGTNVERGREILQNADVENVIMAPTMEGGAEVIVKMVKEAQVAA